MADEKTWEGRVKHCNSQGYGFISTTKRIDFYFHCTKYKGDWKELLRRFASDEIILVEFENDLDATAGPRAKNVRIKTTISA